jgi:hypothetical protein
MENSQVMIHVRFAPNGTVMEIGESATAPSLARGPRLDPIGERPAAVPAQAWFNRLSDGAGDSYLSLSGGRGVFRLARERVDALKGAG